MTLVPTSEGAPAMAYREKLAWLSLGSQLLFHSFEMARQVVAIPSYRRGRHG